VSRVPNECGEDITTTALLLANSLSLPSANFTLSDWQQCQQMPKLLVLRMTSGLDDTLTIVTFAIFAPTAQAFTELLGLTYVEAFHEVGKVILPTYVSI
jgi:hypothetical protein